MELEIETKCPSQVFGGVNPFLPSTKAALRARDVVKRCPCATLSVGVRVRGSCYLYIGGWMVGFHFMDEEICKEMLRPHQQVHRVMILLEPEINSRTFLVVGL